MIWRGPAPYRDHLLCRTGPDLAGLSGRHVSEAEALVETSEWPMFDNLHVVCVDEKEKRVVGAVSTCGEFDILFLVVDDRRDEGIGKLMVEAMFPELEGLTEDEAASEEWIQPYHAVAGSTEGANFLHSLPGELGWRAFALIGWDGWNEEWEAWKRHRNEEASTPRTLPQLQQDDRIYEAQIYTWPDGSDAIVQIEAREATLIVRWVRLPPSWRDATSGKHEDPAFAIDEDDGSQYVILASGSSKFPPQLERMLVGLFLDLGVERPESGSGLVLGQIGLSPNVNYPRFISDERWAVRYEEARALVEPDFIDDLLHKIRFFNMYKIRNFHLYRGGVDKIVHIDRPYELKKRNDEGWTAFWGSNDYFSTWSTTFEGAVDQALEQELILPESAKEAWEKENVVYGTMICPTGEEAQIYRLLGSVLPLWWSTDSLLVWLKERSW